MEEFKFLTRRLFWLFLSVLSLITIMFIGLLTYKPNKIILDLPDQVMVVNNKWEPKNVLMELEKDAMPSDVKLGYLLVTETTLYIGPQAKETAKRYAGNNLACTNCHLQKGSQAGSASWVGVVDRFPQFGGRSNKIGSIKDRINGCMERSMNGKQLPEDSKEMNAIVAYMDWLGEGLPTEQIEVYKGYPKIKIPNEAVDLEIGKAVYDKECMVCHGANGQGIKKPGGTTGYLYPPLWGPDSYNHGAGMHRVITAAEFIKSNMPFGLATWENPKLTDVEAYHVAGYINSFNRPIKSNAEFDYPDKKLKPVSTPNGPWEDNFTPEQHKYGPFPPIISYYKEKYNISKAK
ncbi:c-type cytochrome [Maribacter sp. CXY002]|uniref:c-type cytochrome n=1 Tax=Maribacter luteocoastalis TaxID=3407671 RepID=UPI003B6790D0